MNRAKRIEKLEDHLHTDKALEREIEELLAELRIFMSEEELAAYLAKVEAEIIGGHSPYSPDAASG